MNRLTNPILLRAYYEIKTESNYVVNLMFSLLASSIKTGLYFLLFSGFSGYLGYNAEDLVLYFLIVNMLSYAISSGGVVAYELMTSINDGSIVLFLVRPLNFIKLKYAEKVTTFALRFFVNLMVIIIASFFLTQVSIHSMLLFFISSLLGFSIIFSLQATIGLATVYYRDITRIRDVIYCILLILGGRTIPSEFLPAAIFKFIQYSPVVCVYDIPVRIALGKVEFIGIILQILWLIVFGVLLFFMQNKARTRFEVL